MALTIEEKYDEVRQLITMGKEKGYLLYEEVNDMLPSEISSYSCTKFGWLMSARARNSFLNRNRPAGSRWVIVLSATTAPCCRSRAR